MKNIKKNTGYHLHASRIHFSGGEIVRTVLFPIRPISFDDQYGKEYLEKFTQGIIHDDRLVRGPMNLPDYLDVVQGRKQYYTLFDFWTDSLRCGVIWMPTPADLGAFIARVFQTRSAMDVMWEEAISDMREYFDKDKMSDILLIRSFRQGVSRENLKNRLIQALQDGSFQDSKKTTPHPKAQEMIDTILHYLFDEHGHLKLNEEQQNAFWKDKFHIDKRHILEGKPKGELKDITFTLIPELFTDLSNSFSPKELLHYRKQWLEHKSFYSDDALEQIVGLTDNYNGFSNYFGRVVRTLQNGAIQDIFHAIKTVLPLLASYEKECFQYLSYLSEKAKLLGKSMMYGVENWADYRSILGGKLSSWVTNTIKREKEIDEQAKQFIEGARKSVDYLRSCSSSEEGFLEQRAVIVESIDKLVNFLEDQKVSLRDDATYEQFELAKSFICRELNVFYQKYIKSEEDDRSVNEVSPFSIFFQKFHKPVYFYGEAKRKKYDRIISDTIPKIEQGIQNACRLLEELRGSLVAQSSYAMNDDKQITDEAKKSLDFIFGKIKNRSVNTQEFLSFFESLLSRYTIQPSWEEIKKQKGRYVYYKSVYAKGTQIEAQSVSFETAKDLQSLIDQLVDFLLSFDNDALFQNVQLLLDWIELAKFTISFMVRCSNAQLPDLSRLAWECFHEARRYMAYVNVDLQNLSKKEWNYIVQSLMFSDFRGSATVYSLTQYTAKYTIQVIGSDKKYPLFCLYDAPVDSYHLNDRIDPYDDRSKSLLRQRRRYAIALEKVKTRDDGKPNAAILSKVDAKMIALNPQQRERFFGLFSSGYQLQFLDRFLSRCSKGWNRVQVSLNEWSFVLERTYRIRWDLQNKKPVFEIAPEKEKISDRLYLAVPFAIASRAKELKDPPILSFIATNDQRDRLRYPIIGVDVGEYGLAYCVVKFDESSHNSGSYAISILERGFIEDRNVAKIKDAFQKIQQRSRTGVFERADSAVAEVRENAIGALRNKLHAVLLRHKGSTIYEYSISNFETGSGRTVKIYNSVKRADTEFLTDADKQIHAHVWGKKTKYIGKSVSAYASSYTCLRCLKSVYDITKDDLQTIQVAESSGNIVVFQTPHGMMNGYAKDKQIKQAGYRFSGTEQGLKIIMKIAKDFARPPVNDQSEVLSVFVPNLFQNKESLFSLKKHRGSSCVFVCPFCHFVADADIQAAFFMAIRGILRCRDNSRSDAFERKEGNIKGSTGQSFLKKTQEFLSSIQRDSLLPHVAFA